jgi:protein involved in sex pheromone biosynthesis
VVSYGAKDTSKDQVQQGMAMFGQVMKNVSDFDLDSRTQIYEGIAGANPNLAAGSLANQATKHTREQQIGLQEMVKDLYLVKRQNDADRLKGVAVSAAREASEGLYKAMQDAMPEHTVTHGEKQIRDGKEVTVTIVDKQGVTEALKPYLHPKA